MKLTKRKAFNFLRSYFDVLNELKEDSDKLDFLMSIIDKQFLDQDPKELGFIPKLCYESQRHSIEKSVKGWKTASNTDMEGNPILPPTPPKGSPLPLPPKEEQVQEEVEEKEEEKEKTKLPKPKTKTVFSEEVNNLYYNVRPLFDEPSSRQTTDQITKEANLWKDEIRKLIEIDGFDVSTIEHVVKVVRSDDFWKGNFQTIKKLRTKNKEGVKYIDFFISKFKNGNNGEQQQITSYGQQAIAEGF